MRTGVGRRALIWLGPAPLLVLPLVLVMLHERGVVQPSVVHGLLMAPGIVALLGAEIVGIHQQAVVFVGAGVFWYLLAAALLNSLFGRPGWIARAALILLCAAGFVMASIAWSLRNWNPD